MDAEPCSMEYQKRLKFIDYIKKKFIDSNPNCKRIKWFYFENYDDLESIEIRYFEIQEQALKYYEKHRYENLGACILSFSCEGDPILAFEDSYLAYHIDIYKNECEISDLNESLRSNGRSLKAELDALVRQLTGEDPPQRIYNC